MKKQNGFISSSSSVSISYTTDHVVGPKTTSWSNLTRKNDNHSLSVTSTWKTETNINEASVNVGLSWTTCSSSCYHRIEYFLEAVEKMNSPFESSTLNYMPLTNYSSSVASRNLYNGFVDVVITFPFEVRLAGIELFNPWSNKLANTEDSGNWRYLPSKFSIFKVNNSKINDSLNSLSYENDIANTTKSNETKNLRVVRYDKIENDENLIFLGKYEINWENISSYKCFFKYNRFDKASINSNLYNTNSGTATWKFKQLVLRIYETKMNLNLLNMNNKDSNTTFIKEQIAKFIKINETKFGTKYNNQEPSIKNCIELIGMENISKSTKKDYWKFGSNTIRSYKKAADVKFESGINYKLGGIQLLLSPDIFSVSEMKMYSYSNETNNKVFIGEWNKDTKNIEYYGCGTIKRSPNINISNFGNVVSWKHNFNIPPKYLEAEVYAKFNIDYESFYVGDMVKNLVNINKEPLTIKLTGTEVQINISNGVCFTNPDTGEFMTFLNGIGAQVDKPGNFDAYKAALDVNANIKDYGSRVSSIIKGGYPFDICFVVKRLF